MIRLASMRTLFILFACLICSWADVISPTGQIKFDVQSDNQAEMTLNQTGLGIGTSPSTNLQVNGNALVTGTLNVGGGSGSSNLHIQGTMGLNFESVNSSITLSGNSILLADTSSGNVELSLPVASSVSGRKYTIKKISRSNEVFVTGGGYIDSYTDVTLSTNSMGSLSVISSGGNWNILSIQGNGISIASDNLVGWWKLNESSGNATTDSSSYNRTSNLSGSMSFSSNSIDGIKGSGLNFDGSNYVAVDTDTGLPMGGEDRTIMAWINPSNYTGSLISWGTNAAAARCEFGLRGPDEVVFAVSSCSYGTHDTPAVGTWYHAAMVFSGTNVSEVLIYINGESKAVSLSAGSNRAVNTVSNGLMQFGADVARNPGYTGGMDDVRIYNRALSASEILAIYQQGL